MSKGAVRVTVPNHRAILLKILAEASKQLHPFGWLLEEVDVTEWSEYCRRHHEPWMTRVVNWFGVRLPTGAPLLNLSGFAPAVKCGGVNSELGRYPGKIVAAGFHELPRHFQFLLPIERHRPTVSRGGRGVKGGRVSGDARVALLRHIP